MENKLKMLEELKNESLEDCYYYLCKAIPNKNAKRFKQWNYLESVAYEELLNEEENPNECTKIINLIVDYLKEDCITRRARK